MSMPQISVIIPAYNAADFVGKAIESALGQTFQAKEILVIDDGSKDETVAVVSNYLPQVRLVKRRNGGPAAARNSGIAESTGDWLGMLDADDTWLPNKLERQVLHTRDSKTGIVHAYENEDDSPPPSEIDFEAMWKKNWISNTTALVRRTAFDQVGGLDESRELISVEDYNLWLRIVFAGWQVATCREKLVNYTPTPNSLSRQTERFARAEFANVANLQRRLNLPEDLVRAKRIALSDQYGRDLLHYRNQKAAREMLSLPLRASPTPARLVWWLATFLPTSILDLRRKRS